MAAAVPFLPAIAGGIGGAISGGGNTQELDTFAAPGVPIRREIDPRQSLFAAQQALEGLGGALTERFNQAPSLGGQLAPTQSFSGGSLPLDIRGPGPVPADTGGGGIGSEFQLGDIFDSIIGGGGGGETGPLPNPPPPLNEPSLTLDTPDFLGSGGAADLPGQGGTGQDFEFGLENPGFDIGQIGGIGGGDPRLPDFSFDFEEEFSFPEFGGEASTEGFSPETLQALRALNIIIPGLL